MSEQLIGCEPESEDAIAVFRREATLFIRDFNLAAITLDGEELEAWGEPRVEELMKINPYRGTQVCIDGNAMMPALDLHPEDEGAFSFSVAVIEKDEEAGQWEYGYTPARTGYYHSLKVDPYEGEFGYEYKLRHAIYLGTESYSLGKQTRMRDDRLFGYFEFESTIMFVDDIEEALFPATDPDSWEPPEDTDKIIKDYSSLAVQLLGSRDFHRLPALEQKSLLQDLILDTEDRSRLHDKYVRIVYLESSLQPSDQPQLVHVLPRTKRAQPRSKRYLYIPETSEGIAVLKRRTNVPEVIGGFCVGIECIELSMQRPIRNRKDLIDKKAGLCLVLDPDAPTRASLGLDSKKLVYVPVSAHRFKAEFEN